MIELVEELEKIEPRTEAVRLMIIEARRGEYHDFKNNLYDCGKVEASRKLRAAGLVDLAKRIEQGEFDETPDADDIATMREDVLKMTSNKDDANRMIKFLGLGAPLE